MKIEEKKIKTILKEIISKYGVDILKDTTKINALLKDYMSKLEQERKILTEILETGCANNLLQLKKLSKEKQLKGINDTYNQVKKSTYVSEDYIKKILEILSNVLGIEIKLGTNENTTNVQEFESAKKTSIFSKFMGIIKTVNNLDKEKPQSNNRISPNNLPEEKEKREAMEIIYKILKSNMGEIISDIDLSNIVKKGSINFDKETVDNILKFKNFDNNSYGYYFLEEEFLNLEGELIGVTNSILGNSLNKKEKEYLELIFAKKLFKSKSLLEFIDAKKLLKNISLDYHTNTIGGVAYQLSGLMNALTGITATINNINNINNKTLIINKLEFLNYFILNIIFPSFKDSKIMQDAEKIKNVGKKQAFESLFPIWYNKILSIFRIELDENKKLVESLVKSEDIIHLYIDENFDPNNKEDLIKLANGKFDKYIKNYPEFIEYKKFISNIIKDNVVQKNERINYGW